MITEKDLQEAIAECQGTRNPNASTCIKLAAFLIIKRELFGETVEDTPAYSYDSGNAVSYFSETEFGELITGRKPEEMWAIIDELMTTLQVVEPRLYNAVMRKIKA